MDTASDFQVRFVDQGGALACVEFRVPTDCRVLESLVGSLMAVGVQIEHIEVSARPDHVAHRLRVSEKDGSEVRASRKRVVKRAFIELLRESLPRVRGRLAKARASLPPDRVSWPALSGA